MHDIQLVQVLHSTKDLLEDSTSLLLIDPSLSQHGTFCTSQCSQIALHLPYTPWWGTDAWTFRWFSTVGWWLDASSTSGYGSPYSLAPRRLHRWFYPSPGSWWPPSTLSRYESPILPSQMCPSRWSYLSYLFPYLAHIAQEFLISHLCYTIYFPLLFPPYFFIIIFPSQSVCCIILSILIWINQFIFSPSFHIYSLSITKR